MTVRNLVFRCLSSVLVLVVACGGQAAPEPADLVVTAGRVYTFSWGEPDGDGTPAADAPYDAAGWRPDAEAVAMAGGRVVAIGTAAEVEAWIGPATEVIDVGGAAVLPGLIESHVHAAELGRTLRRVDLVGLTPDQAIERVVAAAADAPAGDWILGWGFDEGAWASDGYPDNAILSDRTPDHPVVLRGLHGFATWANDAALAAAGIDASTPAPDGGEILRRADGSATGVFLNRASGMLADAMPPEGIEQLADNLRAGLRRLVESGYVAVHEAGVRADLLAALELLDGRDELPARVYAMLSAREPALVDRWAAAGPRPAIGDSALVVRSVKAYYDAALGSRGALLLADYSDMPGHRGTAGAEYGFDEARVAAMMDAGFQVGIHAIGDAGNRETLDFLEQALAGPAGQLDGRHRIEHAQVLHPDDLPRLSALGVVASMEPPHAVEDKTWAEDRLGPERVRGAYAWRSLRRAGTRIIFNSDLPGSDHSIFYGLHAAVTRRDKQGQPEGGWYAGEALTPEEAIRAYTVWAAWAGFEDGEAGIIAPGYRADLTVVQPDPMALPVARYGEILDGRVEATVIGGRLAYRR